jgi:hypothetical protein
MAIRRNFKTGRGRRRAGGELPLNGALDHGESRPNLGTNGLPVNVLVESLRCEHRLRRKLDPHGTPHLLEEVDRGR